MGYLYLYLFGVYKKSTTNRGHGVSVHLTCLHRCVLLCPVYGCPDAEALAQPGYWFQRHGNQLEVGCTTGSDRWWLNCDGFDWIGGDSQRNCSVAGRVSSVISLRCFLATLIFRPHRHERCLMRPIVTHVAWSLSVHGRPHIGANGVS